MKSACATDATSGVGATGFVFAAASPAAVAPRLGPASIHLWRLTYRRVERRAPLRQLLAAYLGVDPAAIRLGEGEAGKPYLAGIDGQPEARIELDFNWSHSGEWALVALAQRQPIGVDVEQRSKRVRARELAHRFFAPAEAATLDAVDGDVDRVFIELWCAKEAVLKAAGRGLAFGLERLTFSPRAPADWQLQRIDPALGRVADWRVASFEAAPGYHGVLAWRGGTRKIEAFQLPR